LSSTVAYAFDPATNTFSTLGGTYLGSFATLGGVTLPDGRVFLVPFDSTSGRIYNESTNTTTATAAIWPGASLYGIGCLLPDGTVAAGSQTNTRAVAIWNPYNDSLSTIGPVAGGNLSLASNGVALKIPTDATYALAVDVGRSFSPHTLLSAYHNRI